MTASEMKQKIINALRYNALVLENFRDDAFTDEDLEKMATFSDSIVNIIDARGVISAIDGAIKRLEE